MPHSNVIVFAPIGISSISLDVSFPAHPFKNPFVYNSNNSILQDTFVRSVSSSSAVLAPKRMESPKSFIASPGITVSRSITQIPFPVLSSSITLFNFVSLCVTRSGSSCLSSISAKQLAISSLSRTNRISFSTEAALPITSSSTAFLNSANRFLVSWNFSIVSCSVSAG